MWKWVARLADKRVERYRGTRRGMEIYRLEFSEIFDNHYQMFSRTNLRRGQESAYRELALERLDSSRSRALHPFCIKHAVKDRAYHDAMMHALELMLGSDGGVELEPGIEEGFEFATEPSPYRLHERSQE